MKLFDDEIKEALISGKKVYRKAWFCYEDNYAYMVLDNSTGYLVGWLFKKAVEHWCPERFEIDFDDIYGDDWEIVEDEQK